MTADGMTVWDDETKTYYHTRSLRYRYVRTIYWAVVTSVRNIYIQYLILDITHCFIANSRVW
jgi:hypothetical protein